jgi:hypothetical protein
MTDDDDALFPLTMDSMDVSYGVGNRSEDVSSSVVSDPPAATRNFHFTSMAGAPPRAALMNSNRSIQPQPIAPANSTYNVVSPQINFAAMAAASLATGAAGMARSFPGSSSVGILDMAGRSSPTAVHRQIPSAPAASRSLPKGNSNDSLISSNADQVSLDGGESSMVEQYVSFA